MRNLYTEIDLKKFSRAYGVIGVTQRELAALKKNIANENELEVIPVKTINSSLVKVIEQLSVLGGYLNQKLDNQQIVYDNIKLGEREGQIEASAPQPQIIRQDAERVDGSSPGKLGLLGLGAVGLLAFEPVREAIGGLISLAVDAGKFATKVLSSINGLFSSLFSGTPDQFAEQSAENGVATPTQPETNAAPVPSSQETEPTAPAATPVEKPGFVASVTTGALAGGAAGAVLPFVRARTGAIAGAAVGAYTYFTSPDSSSSSSTPAPAPMASGGSTSSVSPAGAQPAATPTSRTETEPNAEQTKSQVAPGQIPKNDIVALGNYLISKGAEKNKMQHKAFGPVGEHSKNSRHYRGMAIDVNFPGPNEAAILDSLEPQLRAAGYNTIWRKPGHWSHMHVSVGGPEGSGSYGDASSFAGAVGSDIASGVSAGIKETAKILGAVAGELVGKTTLKNLSTPLPDLSSVIQDRSMKEKAAIVESKAPKSQPKPAPPNINISKSSATIQNPPTMSDRNRLYYYIDRFNFDDVNKPTSPRAGWA